MIITISKVFTCVCPVVQTVRKKPQTHCTKATLICNKVKSPIHHIENILPFQVSLD